jgi:hypothetical protein
LAFFKKSVKYMFFRQLIFEISENRFKIDWIVINLSIIDEVSNMFHGVELNKFINSEELYKNLSLN